MSGHRESARENHDDGIGGGRAGTRAALILMVLNHRGRWPRYYLICVILTPDVPFVFRVGFCLPLSASRAGGDEWAAVGRRAVGWDALLHPPPDRADPGYCNHWLGERFSNWCTFSAGNARLVLLLVAMGRGGQEAKRWYRDHGPALGALGRA